MSVIKIATNNQLHTLSSGFLVDPMNQKWHSLPCKGQARMTVGEPKFHAASRGDLDAYLQTQGGKLAPCRLCTGAKAAVLPPTKAAIETSNCSVEETTHEVVEASTVLVPFDNLKPDALALRARLRAGLGAMQLPTGARLHASFSGAVPVGADVENLLLYNIFNGGCNHLLANGVAFELDPTPHTGFKYRYRTGVPAGSFDYWSFGQVLAETLDIPIPSHKLATVWWAVRQGVVSKLNTLPPNQRYCVRVKVQYQKMSAEVIKGILDGLICAFQVHAYAPDAPRRIAASLNIDDVLVQQGLGDVSRAALGQASAPIRYFKDGVQWNPDDTRLVAAEIGFTRSTTGSLSAAFYAAESINS